MGPEIIELEEKLAITLGAEAFVGKPTGPEELWEKTSAIIKASEETAAKIAQIHDFIMSLPKP